MASCRIITSPLTGEEVTSKTWDTIYKEVGDEKLADELYNKLETPEFKNWFGDWVSNSDDSSMVKTKDGEPMLLYHSSTNNFDSFDPYKSRELGFHFGSEKAAVERHFPGGLDEMSVDIKDAREDLKTEIDDFTVYPVFLNVRRMIEGVDYLEADEDTHTLDKAEYDALYKMGRKSFGEPYSKLVIAFYQKGVITKEQAESIFKKDEYLQEILNADGYWYINRLESKGETSYVVFEPENIKSLNNVGTYSSATTNIYKQNDLESSEAAPQTLAKFKEFAERLGLKGKYLNNMVIDGHKINAQGVADIAKGLYYVLEGKQSVAEPEEIMHFAVEALEESDPKLFNQMLSKIGNYNIYRKTFDDYSEDIAYINEDGTPNIRKIKKEAIAKLLVETVIKQNEGLTEKPELLAQTLSWWEQIKQWFLSLIEKAQFNPFEVAASKLDTLSPLSVKSNQIFNSNNPAEVNATLKLVQSLSDPKAERWFQSIYKKGTKELFFTKLTSDLNAPKNQVELLKQWLQVNQPETLNDAITGVLSEMTYTIEINTAKEISKYSKTTTTEGQFFYDGATYEDRMWDGYFKNNIEISQQEFQKVSKEYHSKRDTETQPTQHYSNLTVPGGTNYTEQEIATPAITPSIKGHAQFATDNGIGWFRSDEALAKEPTIIHSTEGKKARKFYEGSKTRRILEVQSDLFQKGRDRMFLTDELSDFEYEGLQYHVRGAAIFVDNPGKNTSKLISREEYNKIREKATSNKQNQFLQLLNKDNNWVTFFVKAVIQDSAKKGYEKVLFPSGNTASKVEGHQTLETRKQNLFDSIKLNKDKIVELQNSKYEDGNYAYTKEVFEESRIEGIKELTDRLKVYETQLKDLEEGGFAKLKPIYNFYENTVTNILKKQGYNPTRITDEYGNKWYEYTLSPIDKGQFYFQKGTDKQEEISNKLTSVADTITKVYQENTDKVLSVEEEANNWYELDGKRIPNRVTDRVKRWYENIPFFRNKKFTPKEDELNNIKREFGISGHNGFESIANRYFDKQGNRLATVLPKPKTSPIQNDANFKIYNKLEVYFLNLVQQYPDAKVFSEVMIYDPKYTTKKGKGEAGTIDLLIVEPSGKANIYDWKFMGDNPNQLDVASYKQGGYDVQLGRYKEILKENYGITSFGVNRAIPIMMQLKQKGDEITFSGIGIGSANPKEIENVKLLPIPTLGERTSKPEVNRILDKLSSLYQKVQGDKVPSDERANKRERLAVLKDAIRKIQTQENLVPLLDAMRLHAESFDNTFKIYNAKYKDQDLGKYSTKEINQFAEDLNELRDLVGFYSNSTVELKNVLKGDDNLLFELKALESRIRDFEDDFFSIKNPDAVYTKFGEQLGQANNVLELLRPEKIIKGLGKLFGSLEDLPNKALNLLVNLYTKAKQVAVDNTTEYNEKLFEIIQKINKNHKGNAFLKLIKQDSHELIDEFDKDFFVQLNKAKKDKTVKKFINDNIDVVGYKLESEAFIKKQEELIDLQTPVWSDKKAEEKRKENEKLNLRNKYSFDSNDLSTNEILTKYIDKKWNSKEFKELHNAGNEDLLEFYNKVREINKIAFEAGYIEYKQQRTFIPFMASSLKDRVSFTKDSVLGLPFNFFDSLSRSDQASFGYINPVSGSKAYILPKYFTHDITKKSDGSVDNSLVSKELGQSMLLYTQAIFKYKAMSDIESQIKLVQNVEGLKNHIETNNFGNPVFDKDSGEVNTLPGNKENEQLFDKFTQYLIYGNKYPLSTDGDTGVNKVINLVKRGINKATGAKLQENPAPSSLIKLIDAINRGFQLKTLGGNPISGMVNWFGGNIQALSQSGEYYPVKDFWKAEWKLKRLLDEDYWGDKEKDVFMQLLAEFKPLSEGTTYDMFKKANTSGTGRFSFSDTLMVFMRKPEVLMQAATFEAVMYNTMVSEGKLVNITDFVKNKYADRYQSAEKFKVSKDEMNAEIKKLKDEKSIIKTAIVKDGNLIIDGLENAKEEIRKYSILSQRIYRKITGNVSDTAVNMAKLDIYTSSMMVFKNWIPKLLFTRFQSLQKVNDPIREDNYEIGRVRLFVATLFDKQISTINGIHDILSGNEAGLSALDHLYSKYAASYEKATGQKFTMDENEFKDMVIKNLQNQLRELAILTSMISSMFALGFVAPPPEDKESKAFIAIVHRTLDKFVSEISFFYNPLEMEKMLSGSMFPALGLFSDIGKVVKQMQRELTGYDFRDPYKDAETVREEAHPVKYTLKLVPGVSSWLTYLTIISPELAKELDVKPPNPNADY